MTSRPIESAPNSVQSVERAMDLLDALVARGGAAGVVELSQMTGLPAGTIHRLLRTMAGRGYVRQGPGRKYQLGAALILLGDKAGAIFGSSAQPLLVGLMETSGETANLAILSGDKVVYVAQAPSKHSLRIFAEVGTEIPPHCSAVGKVLLASRPLSEVKAMIDRTGLPSKTSRTLTDPDYFLKELGNIRVQGFGLDEGEGEKGVRCIAVPVVVGTTCVAAVSVSGPQGRFDPSGDADLVKEMHNVARLLATAFYPAEDISG